MTTIRLDGNNIHTEEDFHREISKLLDFGPYYGNNLDALWDRLSCDIPRPILVIWDNSSLSKKELGNIFDEILKIFDRTKEQDQEYELKNKFDYILS